MPRLVTIVTYVSPVGLRDGGPRGRRGADRCERWLRRRPLVLCRVSDFDCRWAGHLELQAQLVGAVPVHLGGSNRLGKSPIRELVIQDQGLTWINLRWIYPRRVLLFFRNQPHSLNPLFYSCYDRVSILICIGAEGTEYIKIGMGLESASISGCSPGARHGGAEGSCRGHIVSFRGGIERFRKVPSAFPTPSARGGTPRADVLATAAEVRGQRRAPRVGLNPNPSCAVISTFPLHFLGRLFTARPGLSHHVGVQRQCRKQEPQHVSR